MALDIHGYRAIGLSGYRTPTRRKMNAFEEYAKCKADFVYFAKNYIKIVNPKRGLIPFEVHDYQKRLLSLYETHRFIMTKKFRQSGITTVTVMWLLWKCMFEPNQRIFFASKTDREAIHVGKMIDLAIHNMPEWLKPRLTLSNQHEKEFAMTGSKIEFYSIRAACSRAVTYLVIDEAAFIPNMEEKWKMVFPLVSTGGKAIVMSTVNGFGNWFSETWFDAEDGKNAWYTVQIDYFEHPDYNNQAWVDEMKKNLGEIGWRQEVLGEFLGDDTPEVVKMALDHAEKMSNWELGQRVRSLAWRFRRRKKDVESYAFLIEAWKRLSGYVPDGLPK